MKKIYNPHNLSKSERYIAFLLAELPKLKTVAMQYGTWTASTIKKRDILRISLEIAAQEKQKGTYLEFGVYYGDSIHMAASMLPEFELYGFDSFEGFPEDGRPDWQMDFGVDGLPNVPENCTLIKGWFNETLPEFLQETKGVHADFVNIDCDIYSSTREVLFLLGEYRAIDANTIIYLDELLNYKTWIWNEMLALFEFLEKEGFGIEWIATCQNIYLVDDTLIMLEQGTYPKWSKIRKRGYRLSASLRLNTRGIDYGPLHLPHYRKKVKDLADIYEKLTKEFNEGRIKLEKPSTPFKKLKQKIKRIAKGA